VGLLEITQGLLQFPRDCLVSLDLTPELSRFTRWYPRSHSIALALSQPRLEATQGRSRASAVEYVWVTCTPTMIGIMVHLSILHEMGGVTRLHQVHIIKRNRPGRLVFAVPQSSRTPGGVFSWESGSVTQRGPEGSLCDLAIWVVLHDSDTSQRWCWYRENQMEYRLDCQVDGCAVVMRAGHYMAWIRVVCWPLGACSSCSLKNMLQVRLAFHIAHVDCPRPLYCEKYWTSREGMD